MIIDRRLIDRCAAGDLAHRGAVETVFGEYVGGMIEQRLAGNFGELHDYNFLTNEVSASPMEAIPSTTRVSEAGTKFPSLVTRRIPYWSGCSGLAVTGSDTTAGSTVGIGGGAGAGGGPFGALTATRSLLERRLVTRRRVGRKRRKRDHGAGRSSFIPTTVAAGRRNRRFQTGDMGERDAFQEIGARIARFSSREPSDRGNCCPSTREKGGAGFVTLERTAMARTVERLETSTSPTNFRVPACNPLRINIREIGACTKASDESFKRLFEIQTSVRGKIMSPLKKEAAPGLDPATAMPIRATNTAVRSNCLSAYSSGRYN